MARPTRSQRKTERARGAPRKQGRTANLSGRGPAGSSGAGRSGAGRGSQALAASSGKVPVGAKVGFSALLILLVVYLISLGR